MAPLRRYLRITKYSALECRIYVDNPALVSSWLLRARDPVLPRVLESVRPLVLPKLMEERERARRKGARNKGAIRDVLVEDDFEVSLFLTETDTRHSLLVKHRRARDKTQTRLVSNTTRLTGAADDERDAGGTSAAPIDVDQFRIETPHQGDDDDDDGGGGDEAIVLTPNVVGPPPNLRAEDGDDERPVALQDIPAARADDDAGRPKRQLQQQRQRQRPQRQRRQQQQQQPQPVLVDDSGEGEQDSLFGDDDDDDDDDDDAAAGPPSKRPRVTGDDHVDDADAADDESAAKKNKLAMDVIYEGFAIYGRVLCLVVRQRGRTGKAMATASASTSTSAAAPAKPGGQAAMENWIASTQMPAAEAS